MNGIVWCILLLVFIVNKPNRVVVKGMLPDDGMMMLTWSIEDFVVLVAINY